MKFKVINIEAEIPKGIERKSCVLKIDNWDDYGFHTTFELHYVDKNGVSKQIGLVKIAKRGQGADGKTPLVNRKAFERLDGNYCSIGQSKTYYEELADMPKKTRNEILESLRDCVFDPNIYEMYKKEDAVRVSLFRVLESTAIEKFGKVLKGTEELSPYRFQFKLNAPASGVIEVSVAPGNFPPTNLHALIGSNGTGKTRILAGVADALTGFSREASIGGVINFLGNELEKFSNLITVSFSPFDHLSLIDRVRVKGNIRYQYVGLQKKLAE